jgi:hypothetical protein
MSKDSGGVVIGTITDDLIPAEFFSQVLELLGTRTQLFKNRVIHVRGFVGRLDIGRSAVASTFLDKTDGEFLLFIDDDMVFETKDFDTLFSGTHMWEEPAVLSGIYAKQDGSLAHADWTEDGDLKPLEPTDFKSRYRKQGAGGLGFCLIPRVILEAMRPQNQPLPWFDQTEPGPGKARMADDTSFFWRIWDRYPAYLDTKVLVGHRKKVAMYPKIAVEELAVPKKELIVP